MRARLVPLVSSLGTLGAGCFSCGGTGGGRCGPDSAMVKSVIDGDTIVLADDERVRYLLVDTNELSSGDCYAEEARQYNASLVEGMTVNLTYDQECTDRFGRLLAYVTVSGRDVNALLLERGYACVLHIPPNGADRLAQYQALEEQARAGLRGMWGACAVVACDQ